jgi:hypothetical protein
MNKIYEKYIILSAVLIVGLITSVYLTTFIPNRIFATTIGMAAILFSVVGSFRLIDYLYPKPSNLSTEQVKSFFTSKTFWIGFAILIFNGLLPNIGITAEEQSEIMGMDWSNIIQAIMATALIVIRKLDLFKNLV